MGKMKHTLCYMAALVGFTACTQDELTGDAGKGQYPLTLTATVAGGADTRATVEGTWEKGNAITLSIDESTYTYLYDGTGWTSTAPYFWPEEEAPISVSAYSFGGKATGQHAVQADQHTGDGYQSSDFLYAPAVEVAHGEDAELTFYHQTAKVVVNIKKEGIMAENPTHKVAIQGALSGTFTAPTGEDTFGTWTADASEGSITPQAITPTEYAASYQALLIPQTISEGQTLFSFMVDGQTYTYTVPTGGITWETGKEYTYNMTLTMNGTVTVDNAIGLPGGWTDEEEL